MVFKSRANSQEVLGLQFYLSQEIISAKQIYKVVWLIFSNIYSEVFTKSYSSDLPEILVTTGIFF